MKLIVAVALGAHAVEAMIAQKIDDRNSVNHVSPDETPTDDNKSSKKTVDISASTKTARTPQKSKFKKITDAVATTYRKFQRKRAMKKMKKKQLKQKAEERKQMERKQQEYKGRTQITYQALKLYLSKLLHKIAGSDIMHFFNYHPDMDLGWRAQDVIRALNRDQAVVLVNLDNDPLKSMYVCDFDVMKNKIKRQANKQGSKEVYEGVQMLFKLEELYPGLAQQMLSESPTVTAENLIEWFWSKLEKKASGISPADHTDHKGNFQKLSKFIEKDS